MRKKPLLVLLGCSFAVLQIPICRADAPQVREYQMELSQMISAQWQSYMADKPGLTGGVAVYITGPKGNFFAATSMKDATPRTHFRIASVTKTFTAASILLLHEQKKLRIDDLITAPMPGSQETYLPSGSAYHLPYKDQITIKMLLNHRAGVFDVDNEDIPKTAAAPYAGQKYAFYTETQNPEHTFTFDELLGVVSSNQLSFFPPGGSYRYSDTGYALLGKIIERVSGKRYAEFLRENFIGPNSLKQTSFPDSGTEITLPAPFETGYAFDGTSSFDVTEDNMSLHVAEGNGISTADDLARWIRLLIRGEAGLSPSTVSAMLAEIHNPNTNYGLGISSVPGLGYGHDGGTNGYLTVARYDPAQDVTVVISASVINWKDYVSEMRLLHDIGRKAKNILGYSTGEKF
jgi:D-alanyl-D-alanine carboxypeptidase